MHHFAIKSIHIAIVICDHGLGHHRRAIILANYLSKHNCIVTLIGDTSKITFLSVLLPLESCIFLLYFKPNISPDKFCKSFARITSVLSSLPSLKNYDIVISDNLLEVLLYREDAYILAQFFWHQSLKDISPSYFDGCEFLLNKFNPVVFGSWPFCSQSITSLPNFQRIGLFAPINVNVCSRSLGFNLLITGGSTQCLNKYLSSFIDNLNSSGKYLIFNNIFLDPQLYSNDLPPIFRPATFTQQMFSIISHAIVRPGLGIISDLIRHNCYLFITYELYNTEMSFNADILIKYNYGEVVSIDSIVYFSNSFDRDFFLSRQVRSNEFNFDGPFDILKYLCVPFKL